MARKKTIAIGPAVIWINNELPPRLPRERERERKIDIKKKEFFLLPFFLSLWTILNERGDDARDFFFFFFYPSSYRVQQLPQERGKKVGALLLFAPGSSCCLMIRPSSSWRAPLRWSFFLGARWGVVVCVRPICLFFFLLFIYGFVVTLNWVNEKKRFSSVMRL